MAGRKLVLLWILCALGTAANSAPLLYLTPHGSEPVVRFLEESYVATCVSERGEQMTWLGPDKGRIHEKGRIHVEGGKQRLSLVFSRMEKKDKGNYTCISRIEGEQHDITFTLYVYVPIKFVDTPPVQEVKENTSALVKCEVQGDPEPTIKWEVNGTSVDDNPKYRVGGDGLFINSVTLDDRGIYQCQAYQYSAHTNNMEEQTILVKILHGPKGKVEKETAYGFINGTKNLTCEAIAEPPPMFKWMKNNITITEDDHIKTFSDNETSALQLFIHNTSFFGEYTCNVSNKFGNLQHIIHLKEGNKPDVPTVSIKGHTDDTIELEIAAPNAGELPILSYQIEYTPVQQGMSAKWNNPNVMEVQGPPFKIESLMQDTKYALRLAARNAAGLSDYTSEHFVTTVSRETLPTSSTARSIHYVQISSYLLAFCPLLTKVVAIMNNLYQL